MMMRLILLGLRIYLRTLAFFSPRVAGRKAFGIFCSPRFRRKAPSQVAEIMARAERFSIRLGQTDVACYRWAGKDLADSPEGRRPKTALIVHGWESRAARLAQWVGPLQEAGFAVLAFDAPAHGESGGKRTNPGQFADVIHLLDESHGPVHALISHSMGCIGAAVAVGGGVLFNRPEVRPKALLFLAGANSSTGAMADFCSALGLGPNFPALVIAGASQSVGLDVGELSVHHLLDERPIPSLWMHDPEDDEVPFSEGEAVAAGCEHVHLERVEGVGHHRITRDPGVIERGVAFLADATK